MLCASGADASIPDDEGWTALYQAVFTGRADIVDLTMRSNAQVNARSAWGDTALNMAARLGYIDIAKSLIVSGADPNITDRWGCSPLTNAAEKGHTEVTKLLLPITADIDCQDGDGDTALSNAAFEGHEVVARLLLDAGAEIVPLAPGPHCSFLNGRQKLEGYGRDAILRAWQHGQPDVARMILEHAAAGEPENEGAKVSKLWEAGDTALVQSWMNERIANAPENRPEIVALRERVKAQMTEVSEKVKQRAAKYD